MNSDTAIQWKSTWQGKGMNDWFRLVYVATWMNLKIIMMVEEAIQAKEYTMINSILKKS